MFLAQFLNEELALARGEQEATTAEEAPNKDVE